MAVTLQPFKIGRLLLVIIIIYLQVSLARGFAPLSRVNGLVRPTRVTQHKPHEPNNNKNGFFLNNPFREVADMLSNLDDVVDDFLFKRMGNGEVFYGQRKYKPSNRPNTTGQYNGMGLTDPTQIERSRQLKEERMQARRLAREQQQQEQQQK